MESGEFENLYCRYAPEVRRFLLRQGCSVQDAEDLTQDTFVQALLHIDGFRGDCSLSVWLCQIAKNRWYNMLRRKRKEGSMLESSQSKASAGEEAVELLDLVNRLEEPGRTVFRSRTLLGASYEELARNYGKSASWARVTYYRARVRLQEMLRDL